MAELNASSITQITRDIVRDHGLPLDVIGVVLGGGDSDYVEILMNIEGCSDEPCQLSVGVFRDCSEAVLTHDIAVELFKHLKEHRTTPFEDRPHTLNGR